MEKERRNLRTQSGSNCQLIGLDGVIYYALLGDISAGGALIKMNDNASSHDFHVGEMCGLMFRDNLHKSPERLTGKIVRLEGGSVGITFHNQEHIHLKKKFIAPS